MCNHHNNLQVQVRVIAIFIACLTLLVGISSIVHGGDLEMNLVGMVVTMSITFVLFYGAKTKDTTHLLVWLVFSFLQIVILTIGMCYFAIESDQLRVMYNLHKQHALLSKEIWNLRITYITYSVVSGLLTTLLLSISVIVKKFYDELQRREIYHPPGR